MTLSHRPQRGFTLIEALLVVSILSLVSLALFHTLINGLKIWERSRQFVTEEDVAIFFDKAGADLRNAFLYSKIPFKGGESELVFPTRYKSVDPVRNQVIFKMGQVGYRFDSVEKTLFRRQASYGQAVNEERGRESPVVQGISAVRFFYYFPEGESFVLEETSALLPTAISIEVELNDRRGKRLMKKFINLPLDLR